MTYTLDQFGPIDLLTSKKIGTRRIKYELGNTAFSESREFRMFKEFDILPGTSETIKVVSTVDSIIQTFGASLILGSLRIELISGGSDGGDFTESVPVFQTNRTSTSVDRVSGVTMQNGGTHTGGTVSDLLILVAGSPVKQAKEFTAEENKPLGFGPGVFYIRFSGFGSSNAQGVFRARWEEL